MINFYRLLAFLMLFGVSSAVAQTSVLDPNDPIVIYNPDQPPTQPVWGELAKWVKTTQMGWNTSAYKSYIYKGIQFRLKYPKTYGTDPNKKYPMTIFFHGIGEKGEIYNNEYQLFHGGELHKNAVENGTYDGFLLYPQNFSGYFSTTYYDGIAEVINNYLIPEAQLDPYRITVQGLSGGGAATWEFMIRYPKLIAAATPISAVYSQAVQNLDIWKWIPVWLFQGAVDTNPGAVFAENLFNTAKGAGANMKLTVYPGQGHGCWYSAWGEKDFFPFLLRAYKSNPWPLNGRTEFCPNDPVDVTLGLTAGFNQYEWRKDGVLIPTATSNTLNVTELGTYSARVYNGTTWSEWSPIPVVIKEKQGTVTPDIQIAGMMSNVLPTPEGKDSVILTVPAGYASYLWKNAANSTTLDTDNFFTARTPGNYVAKVTEQYGCSSEFSNPFKVIAANGSNGPDAATALVATAISKTAIELNWNKKPNPAYEETLFEIYRTTTPGTKYVLVNKVAAGVTTYTDNNLLPNTNYYYIVRAVNNNAAAPVSNESGALTQVDNVAPSAPGNLSVTGTTATSVSLSWTPSTDDVGVYKYDVYVNGIKAYTINGDQTIFTVNGLVTKQTYVFTLKARDLTGNQSAPSSQVNANTVNNGGNYKVYVGTWSQLPNFNNLVPVATGITVLPDISVRPQETNYGLVWEGTINIPVSGNYTFETYSDDGSMLYIGPYNPASTPLVNNDGNHAAQYREGTINLSAGPHPFTVTFYQGGGGHELKVYWKNTAHGVTSRQLIPASFFKDTYTAPGTVPAAPTNIKATATAYNKIQLTWNDNSNNETGFEVYRSTSLNGTFNIVTTTGANVTSYSDSALNPQTTYYYKVKAINQTGASDFAQSESGGLQYSYYSGTWSALPNFSSLTPAKTGWVANIDLSPRTSNVNYAFKYEGSINIPVTGNYTFSTNSDDGSKLYIDVFDEAHRVVNNDFLQGNTERTGTINNLSAGRHNFYVTFFQQGGDAALGAKIKGPGQSSLVNIPDSMLANPNMFATTFALPAIPAVPDNLSAMALSTSKVTLEWNDNSAAETGFDIYRSVFNNTSYQLLTSIGANDSSKVVFTDSSLLANTNYYYKVRAKNAGGNTAFSAEATALTLNTVPVLAAITDRTMRYGTQMIVNLSAVDPDGEVLTFTGIDIPAFGNIASTGNTTATLTLSPSVSDQDTFPAIKVKVTDQHGGEHISSFTLVVNDNVPTVLSPIANVSLAARTTSTLNLSATNNGGANTLTWSNIGLPAFAAFTSNNATAQIVLQPGYGDAGIYPVTMKVEDGRGGVDTKNFTITVDRVNPNYSVSVNFTDGTYKAAVPWNNLNKKPAMNDAFNGLLDNLGRNSGMGLTVTSNWQLVNGGNNTNNQGYTNYNNGVYPDYVTISSWFSMSGVKQTFKMTGLDTTFRYTFTFFGSRAAVGDNRPTNYVINGTTVTLNATNNINNTVTISNVKPTAAGEIPVELQTGTGGYAYINGMVVSAKFDDGSTPAKPGDLTTTVLSNGVRLNWKPFAFNANAYEVYRAASAAGPFTLLNPGATNGNDSVYTDNTAGASNTFYYAVRATNTYGESPYSDTVSAVIPNRAPVLATIANTTIKSDVTGQININASDDAPDVVTITAAGLPAFASLQTISAGVSKINLTPAAGDVGKYVVEVKATDNKGAISSQSFNIQITDKNITSVYLNCNQTDPAGAPWNNVNSNPFAGKTVSNLLDEAGVASGINVNFVDGFTGVNPVGAITGNDSGIFPDIVMRTSFYDQSGTAKRVRLTGLSATKKYNLVFFGSREQVTDNRNTTYKVGTKSVTLNAASNTANTVQLNGLSPDANGTIEFTVQAPAGSLAAYLNAMVIQSYLDNGIPLPPSGLTAIAKSTSSVTLNWISKSANETGFQIWRSETRNGTYTQVGTAPAGGLTFDDTSLPENTLYYYKVRAVNGALNSEFSNIAAAASMVSNTYINFNTINPAPSPWNNVNELPYQGLVIDELKDALGRNTNLTITIEKNFTGLNDGGQVTGNNSGIFPDKVINESFYVGAGDTAKLRISGLDQTKAYSFIFFGSKSNMGTRTGAYKINDKVVTLNAFNNTTETVRIDKVIPDQNGEIQMSMYIITAFAHLNAMVVDAYQLEPEADGGNQAPDLQMATARSGNDVVVYDLSSPKDQHIDNEENKIEITSVYPNPFRSTVYVRMTQSKQANRIVFNLFDLKGQLLLTKQVGNAAQGTFQETLELGQLNLSSGVYLLQAVADGKPVKTVKLIKQ